MLSTRMGFEPTRAEPIGLAVQRLNHSATSSMYVRSQYQYSHFFGTLFDGISTFFPFLSKKSSFQRKKISHAGS